MQAQIPGYRARDWAPSTPAVHRGRVLLVYPTDARAASLERQVAAYGYEVSQSPSPADAVMLVELAAPDLILVDLDLPDRDGLMLCAELRARSGAAIVATHQGYWPEAGILALHLGADDCVQLPADPYELEARLEAVLRRHSVSRLPAPAGEATLTFDQAHRRVSMRGGAIRLSTAEYAVLERLAAGHTAGVSRQDLQRHVQTALKTVMAGLGRKLAVLPPPSPYILHAPPDRYQLRLPEAGPRSRAARPRHRPD